MNSKRTLSLNKETLAEITADDLRLLAGGAPPPTYYTCLTECGYCTYLPSLQVVCA